MTGRLQIKSRVKGDFYYVKLSFKNPVTGKWGSTTIATQLEVKNNKRRAEAMIPEIIEKYSYLEQLPETCTEQTNRNIAICEYLDSWLKGKEHEIKRSTYETYMYRVSRIKEYFTSRENPKLNCITPKMLDTYFKYCMEQGKINQKTKEFEPLSVRSVRSYKSILYAVFEQAIIDGIVKTNPVEDVRVHGKRNSDYSEEFLFLTEKEIAELLEFFSEKYPRLLGIAFFGAYYGLRRSEILGLKWSSIDYKRHRLTVAHTVVRVKTISAEDSTKTPAGRRILVLFDTAEKCLKKIYEEQEMYKRFFKEDYQNKEGYVFTWENGSCYDPNYISRKFKRATAEFGRPEITLHNLRHSCASMLIEKGWDIKKLQYWLGHTDIQTTLNIYAHFNRERLNTSENDLSKISQASEKLFA